MIELTQIENKEIGQGVSRWGYLQQHEWHSLQKLSMEKDNDGNLLSPEFLCEEFLPSTLLTTSDFIDDAIFTIARIIILDYLRKNEIKQNDANNSIIAGFPNSGMLQFKVLTKKDHFVCTYIPSAADKSYVKQNQKSVDVAKLAQAYASPKIEPAQQPKSNEGPRFGF